MTHYEMHMAVERSINLTKAHYMRLQGVDYDKLTELEKIPLRCNVGEIMALDKLMSGEDMDKLMDRYTEMEFYCGAEGVKRVKEWFKTIK